MFIKLFIVQVDNKGKETSSPAFTFVDTNEIIGVSDASQFDKFERGSFVAMKNGANFYNETFDADALVELIIEARLHPAQCLPNVGKVKDESRIAERLRLGNKKRA